MTKNTQMLYGWAGEPKGVPVKHEDAEVGVVRVDDFTRGMQAAEAAMGQKILQDNQEAERVSLLVADAGLTTLDTGTASTAQLAAQVNAINQILLNLVQSGKARA